MKKYLTKQQIYDKVKKHLLKQGEKSMVSDRCMYRTQRGGKILKCALGCIIQEKDYDSSIEGISPLTYSFTSSRVDKLWSILPMKRNEENSIFLTNLQRIHDLNAPELWEQSLKSFAHKEGLRE